MQLTLLIPELVWSDPEDREVYSRLDPSPLFRLLARARFERTPPIAAESCLARLAGAADESLAVLRATGDGLAANDGHWLCADPIHLRFHQEHLILGDATRIDLAAAESAALIDELNRNFSDLGEFIAPVPDRWYLRSATPIGNGCPPLSQAIGREVSLADFNTDPQLKRLGHEAQMLLHASPVNTAREESARITVNGLWFWGGGRLGDATPRAQPAELWSNNPIARGIARLAGKKAGTPPPTLAALIATGGKGAHLVELDSLQLPAAYQEVDRWCAAWDELERDWFAPLAGALQSGKLDSLRVVSTTVFGVFEWKLTRLAAWAVWRRSEAPSAQIRRMIEAQ